ncbi:putative helicase mov-10-B.1 [Syngnathus scovelli]|uniref:putative helicase mov-10-B.1 n=1 Tax=Syngnathus scovelli TaxID=161590 RepID=UPI00210F7FAC|nr:putative helicase mov-10-B.1 [Syngnathus scovelli]
MSISALSEASTRASSRPAEMDSSSRTPRKKKSKIKAGHEFFAFLGETERANIRARSELKEIYNSEFKARNQVATLPNFSSVLYAMKLANKIHVGRQNIRVKFDVTELFKANWHLPPSANKVMNGVEAQPSAGQMQLSVAEENQKVAILLTEMLKKDRARFISDKNGIVIRSDRGDFNDGSLCLELETNQYVVNLTVENTGNQSVLLTYYTALHKLSCFTLRDEHKVTRKNPLALQPGDSYAVQIHYHLEDVGNYPITLAFEFGLGSLLAPAAASFYIMRYIQVHYLSALGMELKPTAPFTRSRPRPAPLPALYGCQVVDGVPPDGMSQTELINERQLRAYPLPKGFTQQISKPSALKKTLNFKNYSQKFHQFLFMEEYWMQEDIRRYFIPNSEREFACMQRDPSNDKLLILKVPGLAENRPSVLRGDQLLVYPQGESRHKYRGYVHKVERDSVKLGFSSKLLDIFVDGMKFNVEFTFNRLLLRLQHRAVELALKLNLNKVLFPPTELSSQKVAGDVPELSFYNRQLEQNDEQCRAVRNIVAGTSRPAPYLVFGPPGTGKTVTLVEAIKQLYKVQKECHILACASSNSAADLLCTRILQGHGNKSTVYRMYASSRDPQSVPHDLKACSNLVGDSYVFPSKEKLMQYRILVSTLFTAGRLVTGNLPLGHFTHIFVDEAGHATESECLIPLAGLLDPESGQLVLAGDHKQLGPIVASPAAFRHGMDVSLLERLMTNASIYQKDGNFNELFVTKLLRNYRSHPAILKVPNELFYDGELQPCADQMKRNSFCKWECLEKQDFPLIFHGVTGLDEREANSPSFFNRAEVQVLMDYVKKLLQSAGKKGLATISPKDIGIIAPYRKQVQKIHWALKRLEKEFQGQDMSALKVGSVEEFQGQERRVILVCTVRSSPTYMDYDKRFNLGFVASEKRFNVAMTRAQALLIVVGNPVVLSTDAVWKRFIKYCQDEKADRGYKSVEEDQAVAERHSSLFRRMHPNLEDDDVDEGHCRPEE